MVPRRVTAHHSVQVFVLDGRLSQRIFCVTSYLIPWHFIIRCSFLFSCFSRAFLLPPVALIWLPRSFSLLSVFLARDHLSLGWLWGVGCVQTEEVRLRRNGTRQAWSNITGLPRGLLSACPQNVFLRPVLAFQQLLPFQGMRLVAYRLCNWCRFHKGKLRALLTGLEVILQTPWWPWFMYSSSDGVIPVFSLHLLLYFSSGFGLQQQQVLQLLK